MRPQVEPGVGLARIITGLMIDTGYSKIVIYYNFISRAKPGGSAIVLYKLVSLNHNLGEFGLLAGCYSLAFMYLTQR